MEGKGCAPASAPELLRFLDLDDVKNLSNSQDLHDPTSLNEAELYECLAYSPEMDKYSTW